MNFNQLHSFCELYQQKSIAKAAENLYISRQSLTVLLNKLENELNAKLFTRSHHGITPTNAGDRFFIFAQHVLKERLKVIEDLKIVSGVNNDAMPEEKYKIGIAEVLLTIYGEELLTVLLDIFPNKYFEFIVLKVEEDDIFTFYKEYDIAIAIMSENLIDIYKPENFSDREYLVYDLAKLRIYAWMAYNSILSNKKIISFSELRKNYHFCSLKGSYNLNSYRWLQNTMEDLVICTSDIMLKSNLINYISKAGYTAIDYKINKKNFIYEKYFPKDIIIRPTDQFFNIKIIYKHSLRDVVTTISNHLTPYIENEI